MGGRGSNGRLGICIYITQKRFIKQRDFLIIFIKTLRMRFFILAIALSFSQFLFAAGDTGYRNHIAKDRLLLIFDKSVSAETKAIIIRSSGLVKEFVHLPSPALTICFTDNVAEAEKYFSGFTEVKFVSFFITDGKEHYAGVLDAFFVKLTDKNFEPMLQAKLKAENLGQAIPDKYLPNLYHLRNPDSRRKNTIELCTAFLQEGWVDFAHPDYLLNPIVGSADNDPLYNREWNIQNTGSTLQGHGTPGADMRVDSAWTITTGDPGIKIAVIDAGIDTAHPDLRPNLLSGHDAIGDSTNGYPTPNYAEDGHGTCCAGIIGAVRNNGIGCAGVAPSCKLIPVRAFYYVSAQGSILPYSTATAFTDAINWATDSAGADILSNSWGLPPSMIYFLSGGLGAVNYAITMAHANGRNGKGTALFFSSGNDNDSIGPIWPASQPESISVNATNMCDTRKSPTDCSGENWGGDFGAGLDFSAPGVKITTTDMLGSHGFSSGDYYYLFNGTSAACPNAAAVGALLLSVRPDLTADDVKNVIAQSCDRVGGYGYDSVFANGTWSRELGYGRVNAYKALLLSATYNGVARVMQSPELNIFPNPASSVLNIQYDADKGQIGLYDITGKELRQQDLHKGINVMEVSNLSSGIYLAALYSATGTDTRKIMIYR